MRLRHQVLVIGGGHAGVAACRRLQQRAGATPVDVALASRENVELWHGLMPQVLSGAIQPQHTLVPLREVLPAARIYIGEVVRLDLQARTALLTRGREGDELEIEFEYLVLALGSILDVSRFPGMAEHSLPTKTIGDYFALRNHVIGCLEAAAELPDPEERELLLTFVVVGAGYAGVETASEMAELVRQSLPLYPRIDPAQPTIVCVDPNQRILPTLPGDLVELALAHMRRAGIQFRLGVGVAAATAAAVTLSDGSEIGTRTLVATAGTGANPLLAQLPVQPERGRLVCDECCRVVGLEKVFAAGDAAAIPDPKTGHPYPAMLPYAVSEGERAGENVLAAIRGQAAQPYAYTALGEVAVLSRNFAVAKFRGRALRGRLAALLGRYVFLSYLPSWRRRARLALDWAGTRLLGTDVAEMRTSRPEAVRRMRFRAGDTIVRQGELGNFFYVITEGEVHVTESGEGEERVVASLGPGDHFGEVALLGEGRRTAAVKAATETRVIALDRHDFTTLVSALPELVR